MLRTPETAEPVRSVQEAHRRLDPSRGCNKSPMVASGRTRVNVMAVFSGILEMSEPHDVLSYQSSGNSCVRHRDRDFAETGNAYLELSSIHRRELRAEHVSIEDASGQLQVKPERG